MAETVVGCSETSLVSELEDQLAVGRVLSSFEDAYLLYCRYAHAKGFSVRKGDQRYFRGSNEVQAKDFECSNDGDKKERKRLKGINPSLQKPSLRTGCKARLRICREKGGDWTVSRFITEHNHEMVDSDRAYLLRSSRCVLSIAQKAASQAMVNAGISVVDSVEKGAQSPQCLLSTTGVSVDDYVEKGAQSSQLLLSTTKGADIFDTDVKRQTKVEGGDTSSLLHFFIDRSNKESFFYWNAKFDGDNQVTNFFFRDYRCRTDYQYFGDVLTVDATCIKHGLTCVSFVGFNHHKQSSYFGSAFLSDKTEDSYKWLFGTFLESMDGKQSETVFSNTCRAVTNAIDSVFVSSHHRLCQWHVSQDAASLFGSLNDDATFKKLWNRCMNSCESEEEFECIWRGMIEIYHLHDHKWLNEMYDLRRKWSSSFGNNKFSAGVLAIPRSETASKSQRDGADSLIDLVRNYENILASWRERERLEDLKCRHEKPAMIVKNNPVLTQVADLYTPTMYNMFESEFVATLNTVATETGSKGSDANVSVFIVESLGEGSRAHRVSFDRAQRRVECTCLKFESVGVMCRHALKVFDRMHVFRVPECYIKTRWTKRRIEKRTRDAVTNSSDGFKESSDSDFVNRIMMSAYDLAMKCESRRDTRKKMVDVLETAYERASGLCKQISLSEVDIEDKKIR